MILEKQKQNPQILPVTGGTYMCVVTDTACLNTSRCTVLSLLQLFVFAHDWFPFPQLGFTHCPLQQPLASISLGHTQHMKQANVSIYFRDSYWQLVI